jgi:cytochrome c oxidase assembly protein subunit 15
MSGTVKASRLSLRAVRLWLLATAAMIFLTLVVGGATRLTESGLSIVEWKPITGVLPPFSENNWQAEFAKYQTMPQGRYSG